MKALYLECGMGAAGDMLTAALAGLLDDPAPFVQAMNAAGIPGVHFALEDAVQAGIKGLRACVTVHGEEEHSHDVHTHTHEHDHDHDHEHDHGHSHTHRKYDDIATLIRGLNLPETVRNRAASVYALLAEAEAAVHGMPVTEVHFHEVGAMDAVADITACCLLLEMLGPEQIIASPVHVGSGYVKCAHGVLPVPAPAAAYLLRGVPVYGGDIEGELCTPTGAALLKSFAAAFGGMPVMRTSKIAYGLGKKVFPRMNCVRAFLGETEEPGETLTELSCNLDDMTGEAVGFAAEQLREAGAREVFTVPVMMKKGRPGVLLTVLCMPEDRDAMLRLIFRHTATLGVREQTLRRHTLRRGTVTVHTPDGDVRIKQSQGFGVARQKPEYDDIAAIARKRHCALEEVLRELPEPQDNQP